VQKKVRDQHRAPEVMVARCYAGLGERDVGGGEGRGGKARRILEKKTICGQKKAV